ncbi:MAG: hypothetical protein LBC80_03795, partial [Treponema sp.]|nr:hypothetical protein [Treponema sp.]
MSKSRFITTLLMLFTVMALITCDMPLGLGDPVDTTPPHITILSPSDGQWMNDHNRGEPIMLRGTWWDDTGVTEIRILDQKSGEYFTNENYNLNGITIEPAGADGNGTWSAEIVITESGEHTIRVIAFDSFRNQGADIVNIRVDLVDPLVEDAKVLRYLDRGSLSNRFITEESIYNFAHYDEELDFQSPYFYRRIKWADIDKFQNEAFTLRVDFADSYANVVTSRLYVLDENGDRLNPGSEDIDGLVPTRNYDPYKPEWDITAGQLISWNPKYATGASYISFEVFVWNEANWEFDAPKEGGTRRQQRIFGTCWYPESDIPKIAVQATDDALSSGQIFLNTTTVGALSLEVYDDDQLAQIYAGLILKEEFDDLRGSESEADYLSSLVTDTARRDQVIAKLSNNNLFSVADSGEDRRRQIIRLDTGAAGEYRLIAMVRDNKGPESHYFSTPNTPAWAVHPPLRVHVQNPNAPNIIVETPAAENTFPMLSRSGENYEFNVSGYNIDDTGILWMQIAWVPPSFTISDAQAALRAAAGSLEPGESTTQSGIKIWRISVDPNEPVVLNGVN